MIMRIDFHHNSTASESGIFADKYDSNLSHLDYTYQT